MRDFLELPKRDREQLFFETSAQTGMTQAIIEKDFWVCWTLDYLFGQSPHKDGFAFKGGTSLSKSYGLIDRFSEDIDLVLDWRALGYGYDEPWHERSNTKQDAFITEANARASEFLTVKLKPELEQACANSFDEPYSVYLDDKDPLTLCFDYPKSFTDNSILQIIQLESGSLAAWTPTEQTHVVSYVANVAPHLFSDKMPASVRTVAPERTFWEKVTILHKEANRFSGRVPPRYSRHYYDIYKLCESPVKETALHKLGLLEKVVAFTERFYRSNAARYDLAKPGTLRLVPPEAAMPILQTDFRAMRGMLFGEIPDFGVILNAIRDLEDEINSLVPL
ncbi:MAG: nucleotidyl transferase AbiEii/AbiGii toxin family protein [Coriobacteriales bacterium]|jgi:predicted nucleotidyltransferase component of viral defense system|nr:nucleotidyl transferase AbiEii/AbiGii toxin family protein [Coriobacteriales bacterium]